MSLSQVTRSFIPSGSSAVGASEASACTQAVTEDRERIARDLDDRVMQRLFAAGLGMAAIRTQLHDPHLTDRLDHLVNELDKTIQDMRASIFELHSPASRRSRALSSPLPYEQIDNERLTTW